MGGALGSQRERAKATSPRLAMRNRIMQAGDNVHRQQVHGGLWNKQMVVTSFPFMCWTSLGSWLDERIAVLLPRWKPRAQHFYHLLLVIREVVFKMLQRIFILQR